MAFSSEINPSVLSFPTVALQHLLLIQHHFFVSVESKRKSEIKEKTRHK